VLIAFKVNVDRGYGGCGNVVGEVVVVVLVGWEPGGNQHELVAVASVQ